MTHNLFSSLKPSNINSTKFRVKWLQLARTKNVGPRAFIKLIKMFSDPEIALSELPNLIKQGRKLEQMQIASENSIEKEIEKTEKAGARIILSCENDYPSILKKIPDYPPAIIIKGNADLLKKPSIAIVGTRNSSTNGCTIAYNIATELAQKGYIISSGLARGIDAAAHMGAAKYGTIGVIAGGIDVIYPTENAALYEILYKDGVVMTEYPIGTPIIPKYFPQRNRIISGLSIGVAIIEAAKRSGTLITARLALEQGREVFAVPGSPLDPRCDGTNALIKQGAILVINAEDILVEVDSLLNKFYSSEDMLYESDKTSSHYKNRQIETLDTYKTDEIAHFRKCLLTKLSYSPTKLNEIISQLNHIPQNVIDFLLLELELSGKIEYSSDNKVYLIKKL